MDIRMIAGSRSTIMRINNKGRKNPIIERTKISEEEAVPLIYNSQFVLVEKFYFAEKTY